MNILPEEGKILTVACSLFFSLARRSHRGVEGHCNIAVCCKETVSGDGLWIMIRDVRTHHRSFS